MKPSDIAPVHQLFDTRPVNMHGGGKIAADVAQSTFELLGCRVGDGTTPPAEFRAILVYSPYGFRSPDGFLWLKLPIDTEGNIHKYAFDHVLAKVQIELARGPQ